MLSPFLYQKAYTTFGIFQKSPCRHFGTGKAYFQGYPEKYAFWYKKDPEKSLVHIWICKTITLIHHISKQLYFGQKKIGQIAMEYTVVIVEIVRDIHTHNDLFEKILSQQQRI